MKPNERAKLSPAPTINEPPTFEAWLSAGTAAVQKAALSDVKAGKDDTDALNEARRIYDTTYGGNR